MIAENLQRRMQFEKAAQFGEQKEMRLAEVFMKAGFLVKNLDSARSRSRADLVVQSRSGEYINIEVKCEDRYARDNPDDQNFIVEVRQGNPPKLSGIYTSSSPIWIHTCGDHALVYEREKMMNLLASDMRHFEKKTFGRADNENQGYVIPLSWVDIHNWSWFGPIVEIPETPFFQ